MITASLIFFPLIAAFIMLAVKGAAAKKAALGLSLVEFGIMLSAWTKVGFAPAALSLDLNWLPFGAHFAVNMDGISALMALLSTGLVPLIIWASFKHNYTERFYSLVFLMQMALVGVFTATDGFLFYIFWELALIPIYFICLIWGGENRGKITFKFFVYTLAGSLLMLAGFIYVYLQTDALTPTVEGDYSFALQALYEAGREMSLEEQSWVFWAVFIAFAIKMPVFPLHTWQPDTYVTAPTAGTMLLSGIMLKMGTYGVLRWLLPLVPKGYSAWGDVAIILSIVGIIYASLIAIRQQDYKRLIAYSSIAHVGLIAAGSFAGGLINQPEGISGALAQMVAHGINVIGLFFIIDIIESRMKTREIAALGGIRGVAPQFSLLFLIVMLGSVALPLTNGFVGEFLLINGLFQYNGTYAILGGTTVILGAVYMLRSYQSMILGETNSLTASFTDLDAQEKGLLVVVAALIIGMGVYPKPFLDTAAYSVQELLNAIQTGLVQ